MPKSEADREAEERLELMPRSVRDKLDRVRIKLHLKEWQQLRFEDRLQLRDLPCNTDVDAAAYSDFVQRIVLHSTGHLPDRLANK